MLRFLLLCFVVSLLTSPVSAQHSAPKEELRGVWVASVANIDWPSKKNLTPAQQQDEFRRIARAHRQRGLNALFVQIRPAADALYDSPYEPWSEWLTGTQGKAPEPYYDPLEFMIRETHALGMEFHAWLNPFRAIANNTEQRIADNHISKTRPEWMVRYGNKTLLNPGIPDVRDYIIQVITDITDRYDVDGIHFDDYFYPYPEAGQRFNDDEAFRQYGQAFRDRGDWRRDNVNQFIRALSAEIYTRKPWISFGISPFGVWRNKSQDPTGSDTRASIATYDDLYADILLWMKEGWIDYVAPQLYWDTDFQVASYRKLLPWWADRHFGRHLYIGHAAYRVDSNSGGWRDSRQLLIQKEMNRATPAVQGSIYFSSKSLTNNLKGVPDRLAAEFYAAPAFVPAMPWKVTLTVADPEQLTAETVSTGVRLQWSGNVENARFFAIYRFGDHEIIDITGNRNLIAVVPATQTFFIDSENGGKNATYVVSSRSKSRHESRGNTMIYHETTR